MKHDKLHRLKRFAALAAKRRRTLLEEDSGPKTETFVLPTSNCCKWINWECTWDPRYGKPELPQLWKINKGIYYILDWSDRDQKPYWKATWWKDFANQEWYEI